MVENPMATWQFRENVIPTLLQWRRQGLKACLLTLVDVDGSSPRPLGSQMVVNERGEAYGQMTGGCAEKAIIELAQECLKNNINKLVRFGENSPYLDIKLPCGSSIDVFFNCRMSDTLIEQISQQQQDRQLCYVNFDLSSGEGQLVYKKPTQPSLRYFCKTYQPPLRLVVIGDGPIVGELVQLAERVEFKTIVATNDDSVAQQLGPLTSNVDLVSPSQLNCGFIDEHTAVAMLYHDHDKELPVFKALKGKSPLYMGALGSRRSQEKRLQALKDEGFEDEFIQNLRGPIGIDLGAKNPVEISVAIIAEILQVKNRKSQ